MMHEEGKDRSSEDRQIRKTTNDELARIAKCYIDNIKNEANFTNIKCRLIWSPAIHQSVEFTQYSFTFIINVLASRSLVVLFASLN